MNKEYFVQQDAFLEDYKSASKKLTINIDELADQVLSQLNETQEEYYTMPAMTPKIMFLIVFLSVDASTQMKMTAH